jgi:multidrug efflux pump subunit AcrB
LKHKQTKMNPDTAEKTADINLLEEEDLSMEGYDKPVKKAKNILFAIAAIQLIGIYFAFQQYGLARTITIILSVGVALLFFLLALWTKKKPFDAIIIGLVLYSVLVAANAILDPSTIIQGLIMKIGIYVLLISALSNAREVQRWKDSIKK